ncbi:YqaJ domain-containing protein, partial [Aphis craccivora]
MECNETKLNHQLGYIIKNSRFLLLKETHDSICNQNHDIIYIHDAVSDVKLTKCLRRDITNSFLHILGDHKQCEKSFCNGSKLNEINYFSLANKSGLLQEFSQIVSRLANNADSLLMNV